MSSHVDSPESQSWREIRQSVNTRTMSAQGKRRLGRNIFRATITVLLFACLGALAVYLLQGFETPAETLSPVVNAEPVRDVVVLTNGVLSREWVTEQLALPKGIALMSVDLEAARASVERFGQVSRAVVSRDFPDTLVVTIEERVPVIRLLAALEPGRNEPLVVARDGVVYRGISYDPRMINALPWLDGVRLTRSGDGFMPLHGIDDVAEFLFNCQQDAPHLSRLWRVISLAESPRLVIRTRDIKEVVFEPGISLLYRRQFAWFDHIVDEQKKLPNPRTIERIDLSIAARTQPPAIPQVIVKYAPPLRDESAPATERTSSTRRRKPAGQSGFATTR